MVSPTTRPGDTEAPHVQCNFETTDQTGTAVGRAMFAVMCNSFRWNHNAMIGGALLLCSLWRRAFLKRAERNFTKRARPNELLRGKQRHSQHRACNHLTNKALTRPNAVIGQLATASMRHIQSVVCRLAQSRKRPRRPARRCSTGSHVSCAGW